MKKLLRICMSMVLLFISGCSTGQNDNGSGGGSAILRIPAVNNVPPSSNILEQLSWAGAGGGPRGSCQSCGASIDGNQMILQGSEPNQNLAGLLYRFTGSDTCGNTTAEFVMSFGGQVNSNGYLIVELTGDYDDIFVYELYDRDTGELLTGWPIGGSYPCQ